MCIRDRHLKDIEKQKKAKEKQAASAAKVFCFDTLHDIERFAETLNLDKNIPSKLYKDVSNGKYYLFVKKGKLKFGDYTRAVSYTHLDVYKRQQLY